MNVGRLVAAAVVAWLVAIGLGYAVNEVLLAGLYDANAAAFRPEAALMAKLPYGFGVMLVALLAFTFMYAKGYEGGNGVMEGLRFGLLVGLIVCGFGTVWYYVTIPITKELGFAMLADSIVEPAIYGAIVGAIYQPKVALAAAARV